jgi:alkanesulfonate monooxygenase SsuD/methylene tetrahydromethanopterin reductase-like flavin-dependent oxidoreductase (luciferase family)
MITGSPDTVRDRIDELLATTGADEVMAMTNLHGFDDRLRSYELLAEAFRLEPRGEGVEPGAAVGGPG